MPKINVVARPPALTWGHFRPVDSVGNSSEVAQISPETSMPDNVGMQKTKAGFQLKDFTIAVKLDAANTQIEKDASKTDALLKHEQGHFNLLLLTAKAMARELEALVAPTPDELGEKFQTILATHQDRATAVDKAYDAKTKNGLDTAEQKRWNNLIDAALKNNASRIDTYDL